MARSVALLICIGSLACVGRKPAGEFKLDSAGVESTAFGNALFQTTGAQLRPGNLVEPVDNGRVFDAAVDTMRSARRSIHIVTFIWSEGRVSDRIIDALAARTRDGVQCRILVDAVGSMHFDRIGKRLAEIGCEAHKFRPVPGQDDLARDHRKLIIVDGRVGIAGGFGIDDKWDGDGRSDDPPQWRDSNLRVRGPVVLDMQQAFAENWQEATGLLLPQDAFPAPEEAGPSLAAFVPSTENSVVTKNDRLTQLFIGAARKRIWISNAYFVPSAPILALLERKARQGVDVRILAAGDHSDAKPYLPSQRARMDQLAGEGVRAWEYGPTMMHGKTMLVDDDIVAVGSCNLDALSLNRLDEGALVVVDREVAAEEARRFEQDLALSTERGSNRATAAKH